MANLVKNPPAVRETLVHPLGRGRSPGEGNSYPLQYTGLENSMDYSMGWQRVGPNWMTFTFIIKCIRVILSVIYKHFVVVVQSLSHFWLFATPWTAALQDSLSFTTSQILCKLMPIKLVMPSSHLILCCSLLLPSIFPSIRVFSNESALCIRRSNYWSFIFSISLSNEYSGLISFRMGWFDLVAVQGTLKSLLQHHSSKASVLQCSYFFVVSYIHTWPLEKP